MIQGLAKEVEKRMTNVNVTGSQVTLKVKRRKPNAPPPPKYLGHGSCYNISKSQAIPNSILCTRDKNVISEVAMAMYQELNIPKEDIRGMGITISKLSIENLTPDDKKRGQKNLLNWISGATTGGQDESSQTLTQIDEDNSTLKHIDQPSLPSDDECCTVEVLEDYLETSKSSTHASLPVNQNLTTPSRSNATDDEHYVLAIPSISQIHMSQVKALPMELQREIKSQLCKMEQSKALAASYGTCDNLFNTDTNGHFLSRDVNIRFRQTNVKRMLQLAAVKTGQQVIPGYRHLCGNDNISLTQLGKLPLEMQLQIANADQNDLGQLTTTVLIGDDHNTKKNSTTLNQKRKIDEKRKTVAHRSASSDNDDGQSLDSHIPADDSIGHKKKRSREMAFAFYKSLNDPTEFYRTNIQPLHKFMDENSLLDTTYNSSKKDDDTPILQVIEFLSICVKEHRLSDVVVMIRSIYHRKVDHYWNKDVLERIYTTIDSLIQKQWHGAVCLDKSWIIS
jgi:impB/mucB/samB family C-terminal domain